jgi:hypothetical protein
MKDWTASAELASNSVVYRQIGNWRGIMNLPLSGGCMCGAVRYEISEAPLRVYACHCTDCQRVTGSAFSIGVVISTNAFRTTGKELALAPPILAASGRTKRLGICPDCGVWVFDAPRPSSTFPGLVRVVRGGTFDDTHWITPTIHYWTQSALKWVVLDGTRYETQP